MSETKRGLHAQTLREEVHADGRLFAIGGHGRGGALRTVERYDPETETWATVAPMPTARATAAAAALGNKLYVRAEFHTGAFSAVGS